MKYNLTLNEFDIWNQYCPVSFYQAIFKEPPSCPADILPPKGEGAKVLKIQMLAPFGGKWRISAERGLEMHVSIKCKKHISKIFYSQ